MIRVEKTLSIGFVNIMNQMLALSVEIDTFNGNCIEYPYFIAMFNEDVESRISDPRGRLTRFDILKAKQRSWYNPASISC